MSFSLIPNISLIVAVAGVIFLLARRYPEAKALAEKEVTSQLKAERAIVSGKLALEIPSKAWTRVRFWAKRLWHFALEAKDIKKPAAVGYRIKKMLPKKRVVKSLPPPPLAGSVDKSESYYLELIRREPKTLELYNDLGKFYADNKRFAEARDIYLYLIKRDPGNPTFYARLGYASFKLELYGEAVTNYEKSLALDPAQPNRYYNLALALESQGKFDQAIVPVRKALELEPENKKYIELLEILEKRSQEPGVTKVKK